MGAIAEREQLLALSPVDGRYANNADPLRPFLSEFGLIQARVEVMAGWVSMLGTEGVLPDREPLSDRAHDFLRVGLHTGLTIDEALAIKEIEAKEKHDVKAVEKWIISRLVGPDFDAYRTMVHFGCTSEDVNATAYGLNIKRARDQVLLPKLDGLMEVLLGDSQEWASIPLLSQTHGQSATPTTLGKEMRVYYERLDRHEAQLGALGVFAKFSGATGAYNAMDFAYPELDWERITAEFVTGRLGLGKTAVTTQIEPHDWIARVCNELALGGTIVQDLDVDMWSYISRGVIREVPEDGETGSSTMPHKINPINFENSEGNVDASVALNQMLARTLPRSRMQRDLSDSTRLRNLGPAFGQYLIAINSTIRAFSRVLPNHERLASELDSNWAVLTEPLQTVMRKFGIDGAYDRIKEASRGLTFTERDYHGLLDSLVSELPPEAIEILRALRPETYIGDSVRLAQGHHL